MEEKLAFFKETRHAYGRTALLLSGGGGLGSFHIVSGGGCTCMPGGREGGLDLVQKVVWSCFECGSCGTFRWHIQHSWRRGCSQHGSTASTHDAVQYVPPMVMRSCAS